MTEPTIQTDTLRSIPFFSGLSRQELENLVAVGRRVSFQPGRPIVEAGDPGDAMYVMLSGRAEVDVGGRFHVFKPGDFFGEMALLANKRRQATVKPTERVEALEIRADDFQRFLVENPGVTVTILRTVIERLREVQDRLDAWMGS